MKNCLLSFKSGGYGNENNSFQAANKTEMFSCDFCSCASHFIRNLQTFLFSMQLLTSTYKRVMIADRFIALFT
jgi:hypothetical protein